MQNAFSTLKVHFTELEELQVFFLECRSNSKITLIKTKYVFIYHCKNNFGNNGYYGQRLR